MESKKYDLEERLFNFSIKLIKTLQRISNNQVDRILISQLIRSGTSIGANFSEANEADQYKDKKNKVRIAKKEAKETIYWIKILIEIKEADDEDLKFLLKEASEIVKILNTIYIKLIDKPKE